MQIRPANFDDAQRLFEWRNDALTRAMSKTTDPVTWDGHVGWLSRRLAGENHGLFIAEVDGAPVGTCRIDGEHISYTIAPEHRGNDYAYKMLVLVAKEFGVLKAEIKAENAASISAAKRAGHEIEIIETPVT